MARTVDQIAHSSSKSVKARRPALIGRSIVGREVIAWPELGAEALQRIDVRDFTCFVVNDTLDNDLYEQGRAAFRGM